MVGNEKAGSRRMDSKACPDHVFQCANQVRVNSTFSDPFDVKVGVHQGSVLSPLLFIIVLEALSREFRTCCPWELLYADDLVIIATSEAVLLEKLQLWKTNMEAKGLRVNMGKTKCLFSGIDLDPLKDSVKFPCVVCRSGVGRNSILCFGCNPWVHSKCSGLCRKLVEDPLYRCPRCQGNARPIDPRETTEVLLDEEKLNLYKMAMDDPIRIIFVQLNFILQGLSDKNQK